MRAKILGMTMMVAVISSLATVVVYDRFIADYGHNENGSNSPYAFTKASFPVAPSGMAPVDFTYSAALTTPTVVHVKTTFKQQANYGGSNDIIRQFFGDDFNWEQPSAQASGSGVIMSEDGYIVTNYHVVKNADDIEVVFFDKHSAKAELIATDPSTDIALLKVDLDGLPAIRFGDSDSVRVGDWVMAVGNPFDLASTVTAGIVSAKGRKIDILGENASTPVESFIQTDAAVNPGNSGGALVNLQGELIGINTAIATPTGTFAGYSFAVPVNIVKKVVKDLKAYGVVQRAYLGVEVDMTREDVGGVYVSNVVKGSGADESGIKEGDVITHINSSAINSFPELQEQLSKYGPGEKVNVSLVRGNDKKNVVVLLKNQKGNTELIKKETNETLSSLGIEAEEISAREAAYYQVDGGVKVTEIKNGKVFQQTRIREGFVITAIDDKKIVNYNDLAKILNDKKGNNVIIEGFYPSFPNKIYNYGLSL
ncbi:MAG TPA: trypsin-like peptidase domain-containing protein [Chitinophagales bacterium]|nr:trypsin-like peptidase domain-containing protein [Chitinophagales bacterium]